MTIEHTAAATPAGERSLAELLCAARDEYRVEIRLARGGAQAAENYSRRIDRLVMRIYAEASSQARPRSRCWRLADMADATCVSL